VRLLQTSRQTCDSFAAALALGRAYAQQHELTQSRMVLRQAVSLASDASERAWAWHTLGRVQEMQQAPREALLSYRTAWRLARLPEVQRDMLALERHLSQEMLSAEAIATTLRQGLEAKAIGVLPAVDVRVHFAFDQATLTPHGMQQAAALAQALASLYTPGRRFRLIGHTDSRGDETYNDRLSQQRADAVRQYVLAHTALDSASVLAEGRGKRELLYQATTEEEHALNRRVEVRVE
jgi:outer membrane protein OmpA-like peptidoglycan-associated protein